MIKRHEVQVLLAAGFSHGQVAKKAEVSKRSVTRIAQEPAVQWLDGVGVEAERRVGRQRTAEDLRSALEEWLEEDRNLPTVELLHRLRQRGYQGGKTAVYDLVRQLRGPAPSRLMVRFEGLPGEFAQFDFAEVRAHYLSGHTERIPFAAYRLKYSRWVYVEVVPNQKVEALCRSLVNGFARSGGVPFLVVVDNPKTVVIHPKREPIVWNRTFAQLAVDFGSGIELCAPRRGNQKGSVENLVGWVKGSFFKVRRFHDFEDLRSQLQEWLEEANDHRPCRATGEIPAVLMADEHPRLRPLAVAATDYGLLFEVVVGLTGMVEHKGIRYTMPPEAIGFPATLHLYPNRVRVTAGRYETLHPRFPEGDLSYPPEIRAQHLAAVPGARGRLYFKRQRILELGPVAVHFFTELVHQRPRTWKTELETLYQLLGEFGEAALLEALHEALLRGPIGAEYVTDLATRKVSA